MSVFDGASNKPSRPRTLSEVAGEHARLLRADIASVVESIVRRLEVEVEGPLGITLSLDGKRVGGIRPGESLKHAVKLLLYEANKIFEDMDAVSTAIAQIVEDYVNQYVEGSRAGIGIERVSVTDREELYYKIARSILERYIVKTFWVASSSRESTVGVYCFDGVSYRPCENTIVSEIERLVGESTELSMKTTRWIVNEARAKIERWTLTPLRHDPLKIAFRNGVVLDWEGLLRTGRIRGSLERASPDVIVFHAIPHNLDVGRLEEALRGLERYDESMMASAQDIERLAERLCPKALKAFRDWVGEKWILLFEIIGYTLYPKYDMHKAVMLVGGGRNGKSTYLRLVKDVLGPQNVASMSLQDLSDEGKRFTVALLYHKLANIYPDLPNHALKHTGRFKILTGEDPVTADRKFRDPITFVNYAKLIFSANELPPVNDTTIAFWRRWIVVEFPKQFPLDPGFYERTFTEDEKEGVILVSLVAFRLAWKRRRFSFEESEADYKELWMRKTNSVYAFIQDLLAGKVRGVRAERDRNARVETKRLYPIYVGYCEEEEVEPVDKRRFTIEMERLGYPKVTVRGERYYKGIKIVEESQSTLS